MQKLLAATLSVLGLALVTATSDQAQAQTWSWRQTQTVSGQQSGRYVGTYSSSTTINGVVQAPVTKTFGSSYTKVYPTTTYTQIGSNWDSQNVRSFISTPPVTHQFANHGNSWNSVIVPQYSEF